MRELQHSSEARNQVTEPGRDSGGSGPVRGSFYSVFERWCPGEDSNLHELLHWYLKPARLPVPPPGQDGSALREAQKCTHWVGACQSRDSRASKGGNPRMLNSVPGCQSEQKGE